MSYTRTQVMLSFLAGCLVLNGFVFLAIAATVFVLDHHIFIMAARTPAAYVIVLAILLAPVVLGALLARRAFTAGKQVSVGSVIAFACFAIFVLVLQALPLLFSLMGSIGMDIHFRH